MIKTLESQEQITFVNYLDLQKIPYYHIPNGGFRNLQEAIKFKRLGVKSGVPDICIPVANYLYHGLYIELKRPSTNYVSKTQEIWLELLTENGYCAKIAHGAEKAIDIVNEYFLDIKRGTVK